MTVDVVSTPFIRCLDAFFHRVGLFVADHDRAVLIVSLVFSLICSSKILWTPQEDDIKTGYTPYGARSLQEIDSFSEFFSASGDPIAVFLFLTARDEGSMTEPGRMAEVGRVLDVAGSDVIHRGVGFYEICTDFCQINEPVRQFVNGIDMQQASNGSVPRFALTFPVMQVLGKELDLSPNFFGVRTQPNGTIDFVKIVMLQLRANAPAGWAKEDVAEYERSISRYFHKEFTSPLLNVFAMSLTFTGDEIVRTGLTIFPFIAVGFLIMAVFSVLTVYWSSSRMGLVFGKPAPYPPIVNILPNVFYCYYFYCQSPDFGTTKTAPDVTCVMLFNTRDIWSRQKALQAVLGCVCPLLATSSALGLLFWCGFRFGTILCVTPFLILAIGVDDAYLQIHSCSRLTSKHIGITKRQKIAEMLVEVGPSISITSLTNLLAFLIGIYTPTPEISLFCAGNAVAILFDFVYQMTFYTAALSLTENTTSGKEGSASACRQINAQVDSKTFDEMLEGYSEWISNGFTHVVVLFIFIVYLVVSVRGAASIQIMLSPDKLVIADSPLLQINYLRDQFVLPNYTTVNIFVQNPGDLSNEAQLRNVFSLIENFEAYPECLGVQFSHFFVRDYWSFEAMTEEEEDEPNSTTTDKFSKNAMNSFLTWPEFQHWNGFVKFNDAGRLSKFWATVSYHGSNLGDFQVRKSLLHRWRASADEFPQLNVSIFDDYAPFVDQLDTILSTTISTSLCTLLCMAIVCFVFMRNLFTVFVATLAITSICIGVFGFLSLWGVDLDPISTATTIMSIGFSVDFPAHVTFHYYREGLQDPQSSPAQRVARSLSAIGFPLLQCGVSTILFVVCLLFVSTYMSEVFVKTIVLVVSLGLIHGLFIVPAFLCAFSAANDRLFNGQDSWLAKFCPWRKHSVSSQGKITA